LPSLTTRRPAWGFPMAPAHHRPMSAGTRQQFIRFLFGRHIGLNRTPGSKSDLCEALDFLLVCAPLIQKKSSWIVRHATTWQEWITLRAPELRAELEALTDDALRSAYDHFAIPLLNRNPLNPDDPTPEWLGLFRYCLRREQREKAQRKGPSHRSVSRKGGHAHRSRRQIAVLPAILNMLEREPKLTASRAHKRLSGRRGYRMRDGRVIRLDPPITISSFRRWYWTEARKLVGLVARKKTRQLPVSVVSF
jgi:hypothetical protein